MTYLFLHPIMHLLLFLSPDWLTFCHVIISYINSLGSLFIFCFSLTKGQCSKHQTILSVLAVHRPFYISICMPDNIRFYTTYCICLVNIIIMTTSRRLRSSLPNKLLQVPLAKLKPYGERTFLVAAPKLWNSLPNLIRQCSSLEYLKYFQIIVLLPCKAPLGQMEMALQKCFYYYYYYYYF